MLGKYYTNGVETKTSDQFGKTITHIGGTLRDSYGNDLLGGQNNENTYDSWLKKFKESRNNGTPASTISSDGNNLDSKNAFMMQALIEKWKRGDSLSAYERKLVREYLTRQGYYSEALEGEPENTLSKEHGVWDKADNSDFNQFLSSYVRGENQQRQASNQYARSSGGSGGGSGGLGQTLHVGGTTQKKTTDSSKFKRVERSNNPSEFTTKTQAQNGIYWDPIKEEWVRA